MFLSGLHFNMITMTRKRTPYRPLSQITDTNPIKLPKTAFEVCIPSERGVCSCGPEAKSASGLSSLWYNSTYIDSTKLSNSRLLFYFRPCTSTFSPSIERLGPMLQKTGRLVIEITCLHSLQQPLSMQCAVLQSWPSPLQPECI